jgi:uncharacterized protein (TIGR03083 family)
MDLWPWIVEERTSMLRTFEGLTAEQWDEPSLSGDWTVRQVLAHLVLAADPPMGRYAMAVVKAGGSFDKANHRLAVADAERPTDELIARYHECVHARFSPPGIGPRAPLTDIVLHSLDVRIPLRLPTDRPPERCAPVLDLLMSPKRGIFVPKGRPHVRWAATDHPWTHGTGDEVRGAMADLALAASGRDARVDALTGPGQPVLAAWLRR